MSARYVCCRLGWSGTAKTAAVTYSCAELPDFYGQGHDLDANAYTAGYQEKRS